MIRRLLKKSVLFITLLVLILPAQSHSIKLSMGFLYGSASSFMEAIVGYSDTKFEAGSIIGVSGMLLSKSGLGCELLIESYKQELNETGISFGELKSNIVLLLFKAQGIPSRNKEFTVSADIGMGINFTSFDKGYFFKEMESHYNVRWTIETDNAFIFEFGLGVGYFLSQNVSVSFDLRIMFGNVYTVWTVENLKTGESTDDLFYGSTIQPMLILRYWF